MKFVDKFIFRDERFSVGVEESTGIFYLSIPVANPFVDYEEYYAIESHQFHECPDNIEELKEIAALCRQRGNDDRLIMKPGSMRGSPI